MFRTFRPYLDTNANRPKTERKIVELTYLPNRWKKEPLESYQYDYGSYSPINISTPQGEQKNYRGYQKEHGPHGFFYSLISAILAKKLFWGIVILIGITVLILTTMKKFDKKKKKSLKLS